MEEYIQIINDAKPGQIIPLVKEIDIDCPVEFFAKLSDYGRKQDCCLFESRDHRDKDGEGNKGSDGAIDSEVIAHLEEMGLTQTSPMEISRYGFDVIRMERIDVRA